MDGRGIKFMVTDKLTVIGGLTVKKVHVIFILLHLSNLSSNHSGVSPHIVELSLFLFRAIIIAFR